MLGCNIVSVRKDCIFILKAAACCCSRKGLLYGQEWLKSSVKLCAVEQYDQKQEWFDVKKKRIKLIKPLNNFITRATWKANQDMNVFRDFIQKQLVLSLKWTEEQMLLVKYPSGASFLILWLLGHISTEIWFVYINTNPYLLFSNYLNLVKKRKTFVFEGK